MMTGRQIGIMSLVLVLMACSEQPPAETAAPEAPVQGARLDAPVPSPVPEEKTAPAEASPKDQSAASPAPGAGDQVTAKAADLAAQQGTIDPNATAHVKMPEDQQKIPTVEGYLGVNFSRLGGFDYDEEKVDFKKLVKQPAPEGPKSKLAPEIEKLPLELDEQLPDRIKQMHGKKIALIGYMVPVDFRQGKTNEFILTPIIPSCFFCQKPQLNEWIHVKIKDGQRVDYPGDGPTMVTGVLDAGVLVEDGFVTNLYRMEGHGAVTQETP